MKRSIQLIFFLGLSVFSCKKAEHSEEEVQKVNQLSADFKIPSSLWDKIEGSQEDSKKTIVFVPIRVKFYEKTPGVLSVKESNLQFPRGGGVLDLSEIVSGTTGTFYFQVTMEDEYESIKVYYLSNARKRKIDGSVYGVGCNKYLDISKKFWSEMKSGGLKINTYRNSHTTLLSGHFIFVASRENQIHVTQLTFQDSEKNYLLCSGDQNDKNDGE